MLLSESVLIENITQELEAAEKKLQGLEVRREELSLRDEIDNVEIASSHEPRHVQLANLTSGVDSLALAHAMMQWSRNAPVDERNRDEGGEAKNLNAQAKWCCDLADLLMRYSDPITFQQIYVPLYEYLFLSLLVVVRRQLESESTDELINQCQVESDTSVFAQACFWLEQLQNSHRDLVRDKSLDGSAEMVLVKEVLRPLLKRVRFHFVDASPDRITTNRVDRLPEWLLAYLRNKVLEDGTLPLIQQGLSHVVNDASSLHRCFWQELVRLIEWVFLERQYFRHVEICGPRSNPIHLYNAVECFLLFDRKLRESVGHDVYGLIDTLVMADDELRQWFLEREKEAVFSTLFKDDRDVPKPLANHVSPRAEIFCALIRAVQWKASIMTEPGLFLRHVAVPLCSQFVDALQATSTDLRNLLSQRHGVDLMANLHEWIEIINGTRLASRVLLKEGAWQDGMPATSQSDHDLARFGRSLERLVDVLVDELASTFVETILMDQAKFASYLMMVSRLLASQEWDGDDNDLSAELKETRAVLLMMHKVCHSILDIPNNENPEDSLEHQTAQFAPQAIQEQIMSRVADKLLEVVIDSRDTTPDWYVGGSQVFSRDVEILLGAFSDLALVQRLLDITKLLTLESTDGLLAALDGLVGGAGFLDIHDFSSDETIYDEAVMMLQAKGFLHLELKDAVLILNRRRD